MYKIMIATHGRMCEGLLDTIKLLTDDTGMIQAIPFYVEGINGDKLLEDSMAAVMAEDTVVIFTDIPGGSVNQKLLKYAAEHVHIITGVNLPILYAMVLARGEDVNSAFIREKIEESRSMLLYVNELTIEANTGDE